MINKYNLFLVILLFSLIFLSSCKKDAFNISKCNQITDVSEKETCYNNIIKAKLENELTVLKNDPSYCDQVEDSQKYECYQKVFELGKKEPKICDGIIDNSYKEMCYEGVAIEKQDLNYCEKLQSLNKAQCIVYIAIKKQDPNVCDRFSWEEAKNNCYSMFITQVESDLACDKFQKQNLRDECYEKIAINKQDFTFCNKIEFQNQKDYCYSFVSRGTKNMSLCKAIQDEQIKDHCFFYIVRDQRSNIGIGASELDPTMCNSIKDTFLRCDCILIFSPISICEKIKNKSLRDDCYWEIADAKKEPSICAKIQDEFSMDTCYRELGVALQNSSICKNIQNKKIREECYYTRLYSGEKYPLICYIIEGAAEEELAPPSPDNLLPIGELPSLP